MSHGGSKTAVYTAIGANLLITVAKLVGYFLTSSGAMLAEGIHSAADSGNQILLAIGMQRAERPPDAQYPDGYVREAFVWALISAVGIFFVGCGATVLHGLESLVNAEHHEIRDSSLAIGILLVSLVLEGASGAVALRVAHGHARERGLTLMRHIRTSDDPFELAILMEDGAALLGILFALAAIGLTQVTQQTWWDPAGSIVIGGLLGTVAVVLIRLNRGLLIGRAVAPAERELIRQALVDPIVDSVTRHVAVVVGTDRYAIRAGVDFNGHKLAQQVLAGKDLPAVHATLGTPEQLREWLGQYSEEFLDNLTAEIGRLESKIRDAVPRATDIELEPDRTWLTPPGPPDPP